MFAHRRLSLLLLTACLAVWTSSCESEVSSGPSDRDLARASALYADAVRALDTGDNMEAIDLLNRGLKLNPDSQELHETRSAFGERVSHYEEVIESTEWLLERDPGDADYLARVLRAGMNGGQIEIARSALSRLRKADPGTARTESLAARFFLETGELAAAENHARKSVELLPEQTAAHHVIGLAREFAGEPEQAIESYRRVIFVDPGHLGARDHMATLLLRLDRRKESRKHRDIHTTLIKAMPGGFRHFSPSTRIESFSGIVEILPNWFFGYMELARALMQDEQLEESRTMMEQALALEPRVPELNELMSSLLRKLGDADGARRYAELAGTPWAGGELK